MAKRIETQINAINPLDHLKMVTFWAKKMGAKSPIRDSEEFANGCVGLIRACQLFDPNRISPYTKRSVAFSSYAAWAIRREILRPRIMANTSKRGGTKHGEHQIKEVLFSSLQVDPSLDITDREPSADNEALAMDLLRVLNPRHRYMVEKIIMEGWTLKEVGKEFFISAERVRQIVEESLYRIRIFSGIAEAEAGKQRSRKLQIKRNNHQNKCQTSKCR